MQKGDKREGDFLEGEWWGAATTFHNACQLAVLQVCDPVYSIYGVDVGLSWTGYLDDCHGSHQDHL